MKVCYTNNIRVGSVVVACLEGRLFTVLSAVQNCISSRNIESERETRSTNIIATIVGQSPKLLKLKRLGIGLKSCLNWGRFVTAVGLKRIYICTT